MNAQKETEHKLLPAAALWKSLRDNLHPQDMGVMPWLDLILGSEAVAMRRWLGSRRGRPSRARVKAMLRK